MMMSGLRSFEVTKLFKIKHKKIKQMQQYIYMCTYNNQKYTGTGTFIHIV